MNNYFIIQYVIFCFYHVAIFLIMKIEKFALYIATKIIEKCVLCKLKTNIFREYLLLDRDVKKKSYFCGSFFNLFRL